MVNQIKINCEIVTPQATVHNTCLPPTHERRACVCCSVPSNFTDRLVVQMLGHSVPLNEYSGHQYEFSHIEDGVIQMHRPGCNSDRNKLSHYAEVYTHTHAHIF